MKRLIASVMFVGVLAAQAHAVDLLGGGGSFEPSGGEVPSWNLLETYTNTTGAPNSASVNTVWADKTTTTPKSLWLRSFAGGATANVTNLTNAILSQTVSAAAGQTYNFSGYSLFEAQYSGGLTTLGASSPLGAVASPTTTKMKVEFLNSGGSVIGSPLSLDVRADRVAQVGFDFPNDNNFYQHILSGVAPAGTVQARVSFAAENMVHSGANPQSAFVDTFSMTNAAAPGTELLLNPNLDDNPPSVTDGWTFTEVDPVPATPFNNPGNEVVRFNSEGFTNHTPGGGGGIWLSPFFGEAPSDLVGGSISKAIPGIVGETYSFGAWANFEANYTASLTYMELSFLDGTSTVIGTPSVLDLATDGQTNGGGWLQHFVQATAPAGTVSVQVKAGFEGGVNSSGSQSAFFDDLTLEIVEAGQPGDFDGDGDVDGADFLVWQRTDGTPAGLTAWQTNYPFNPPAIAATSAVPEPASLSLVFGLALAGLGLRRR